MEEEEERAMPCHGPKASELFGKTTANKNIVGEDLKLQDYRKTS